MNFCIYCGKELSPGDNFCQSCGKPVMKETVTERGNLQTPAPQADTYSNAPVQPGAELPRKKSGGKKAVLIISIVVIILAIILGGGYAAYRFIINKNNNIVNDFRKNNEQELKKEPVKTLSEDKPKVNSPRDTLREEKKIVTPDTNSLKNKTTTENNTLEKSDCGYYPYLSTRKITPDELAGKSQEDLRLMRNEIFMRHGYIFKSPDLQNYASKFPCYKPVNEDVNNLLSETEKYNIEVIKKKEKK